MLELRESLSEALKQNLILTEEINLKSELIQLTGLSVTKNPDNIDKSKGAPTEEVWPMQLQDKCQKVYKLTRYGSCRPIQMWKLL